MYERFGLTLMVTHACNMRCSYCYGGEKSERPMPEAVGMHAIDRALASLEPGGTLQLGFFGGEPLLEARLVARLADYARLRSEGAEARVAFSMTTNGTIAGPEAWDLMTLSDMNLAVSFDGLPHLHDRHRRFADGLGTATRVLETMRHLLAAGKEFRAVMVVGPDSAERLGKAIDFLRVFGVRRVELTLDLWANWQPEDVVRLEQAIECAALMWGAGLPGLSVNWFDEKAARVCGFSPAGAARCGFGDGEVAVAPSGHLYPCERLIGEDTGSNPMRLPGHALDGRDFLRLGTRPERQAEACSACSMDSACNTTCPCSNYVRTGSPSRPDRLLCILNQACMREAARVMGELHMAVSSETR